MQSNLLRFDENKTFLWIDCETESLALSLKLNRFWQIAYITVKGNTILNTQQYYVKWNPAIRVSQEAVNVTGFDQKQYDELCLDQEIVFNDVYEKLESADFIAGQNLIGFDFNFFVQWYQLFGKPWQHLIYKCLDTNALARGWKMNLPYKEGEDVVAYQYKVYHNIVKNIKSKLYLLAEEFEIPYDSNKLHQAIEDLKLNIKVWDKLKFKIQI